jgi:hypothetical protein
MLREDDGGLYLDDDHFFFDIYPLPAGQREALSQAYGAHDEEGDGEYSISYNLSRTLQK